MPTSVLLAVLAAAGLLALAPALTRRYDATERVAVERATSTARVLARRRRRRSTPGRHPVNPPSFLVRAAPGPRAHSAVGRASAAGSRTSTAGSRASAAGSRASAAGSRASAVGSRGGRGAAGDRGGLGSSPAVRRPVAHTARGRTTALHRRRRVFLALVLLNLVELAGVALVGPGFWIGFSVSFTVLVADLFYLRHRAVHTARLRQRRRLRAEWIAREQAAVRREHDRRSADRIAAARKAVAERDRARRDSSRAYVERYRAT